MIEIFNNFISRYGISSQLSYFLIISIIFLSIIIDIIAKKVILNLTSKSVKRSKVKWDDVLFQEKVFHRLSHITPALVISMFAPVFPAFQEIIRKFIFIYIVVVGLSVATSLTRAVDIIYRSKEFSRHRPIKGYLQVVLIFIFIIAGIIIIATLMDESPLTLLGGIGAMTAVITLIFKDSVLGLVAGIQLSANNMVSLGDWISMPKYDADGDVIDITLNTVKVQNWDMTITTIPSYALISDSFTNWKGMEQSGGRRIKRAIYIDMTSISFCDEEMITRYRKIQYIDQYITNKKQEVDTYNQKLNIDTTNMVNGRRMTNIGTFRVYVEQYLRNHPKIHETMTLMVRQLPSTEHGLPIEIYAFTNDITWERYEAIQSDLFDHVMAIVPQFDLRVFQNPTGYDWREYK